MSSSESKSDYWINYWRTDQIIEHENPQCQVGRTVNRIPIDPKRWSFHLHEIGRVLDLQPGDTLLDLCAGNGLITMPLSLQCRSTTAVDISETLLASIDTASYPSISVMVADVRNISLQEAAFSKGLMYGALQYFTESEAVGIFETIFRALIPGGKFLLGDIPDIDRLFAFYCKPEWVKAYFDSVKTNTPAVGTWFKKEILVELAKYVGFGNATVLGQHPDLINSHYRFDLLLTK